MSTSWRKRQEITKVTIHPLESVEMQDFVTIDIARVLQNDMKLTSCFKQ